MGSESAILFQGSALTNLGEAASVLSQAGVSEAAPTLATLQAGLKLEEVDEGTSMLIGLVDEYLHALGQNDVSSAMQLKNLIAGQLRSLNREKWIAAWSRVATKGTSLFASPKDTRTRVARALKEVHVDGGASSPPPPSPRQKTPLLRADGVPHDLLRAYLLGKAAYVVGHQTEDPRKVALTFEEAARAFEKAGDRKKAAVMYLKRAGVLLNADEYLLAAQAFGDVFKAHQAIGKDKIAEEARKLQALLLEKGGELQKALDVLGDIAELEQRRGNMEGLARVSLSEGHIYRKLKNWSMAALSYNFAASFFSSAKDLEHAAASLGFRSLSLKEDGDSKTAARVWELALRELDKIGKGTGDGHLYELMGNVLMESEEFEEAAKRYDKAAFWMLERKHPHTASVFEKLGRVRLKLGDLPDAFRAFDHARDEYRRTKDEEGVGRMGRLIKAIRSVN